IEIVKRTSGITIDWTTWFVAIAPVGILLLITLPLFTYWLYPPEIKRSEEVPRWADKELRHMGRMKAREVTVAVLVMGALLLWIFGDKFANPTTVALMVVAMMLVVGVFAWEDIVKYSAAWNTLAWFATLVALADGLNKVGFLKWFAEMTAGHLGGV